MDMTSPYVGLQPFSLENEKYFFGRERDSRIISSNLFAASLTVLYGASGVGKSSVLQAGVVPLLQKSPRTIVVSFQRWPEKDPLQILKIQCLKAIQTMGYENVQVDTDLPLDEFLHQATQAFYGTIIIILDQFEEYFLYHSEAENTFDAEFARTVNRDEIDANFLIALREDSLSMLDRFRTRIPNLLGNALRLRHLDAASAREAICKPLEVYNQEHPDNVFNIEDSLVDELIQEVRIGKLSVGEGGYGRAEDNNRTDSSDLRIEAPFLQLVLTRLWNQELTQKSNLMRLITLEKLGGADRIVRTHLDNAMMGLPSEDQEIAASIFRYLVTPSGTKIAYTAKDLAYYAESTQPLESVLEKLAQGHVRILRRVVSPTSDEPSRYEIYHDVLAPAILDWRARYKKNKELAEKRKELDQELAQKLDSELSKERDINRKRRRTLITWAFWGIAADLVLSTLTLGCGYIIPLGGWVFTRGLQKLQPTPTKKQNRSIIISWLVSHLLLGSLGSLPILLLDVTTGIGIDRNNVLQSIWTLVVYFLIALGFIINLASGPIGGLWYYRRINRAQ